MDILNSKLAAANTRIVQAAALRRQTEPLPAGAALPNPTSPFHASDRQPAEFYAVADVPKRHTANAGLLDGPAADDWTKARDKVLGKVGRGFMVALIGTRGPGKTQIGQQLIQYAAGGRRSGLYVRAMTVFLEIRATYKRQDGPTEMNIIDKFRIPQVLVIDELQDRGETLWEDRILSHIIDLRYGDMNDTLMIANLRPDELAESLGPAIVDRLRETGGIMECNWDSFRDKRESI